MQHQNNHNEELGSRDFKGIWIPREIWLHKELSPIEKLIWAEIHSLYNRSKGGCFATNQYLAGFFSIGETYVSKIISKLKSFGFIEEVAFNGRQRIIRAILPPENFDDDKADLHYSARQTCTKVQGSIAQKCKSPLYIENKEDNKDIYMRQPEVDAKETKQSHQKKPKIPYKSVHLMEMATHHPEAKKFTESFNQPLVGISDEHHQELTNKHGLENTKKFYIYLADWKASKAQVSPKDVKKHSDYYRIKKWVIKEVLENQTSTTGSYKRTGKLAIESDKNAMAKLQETGSSTVDAEEFAKKILEKEPNLVEDYYRKYHKTQDNQGDK